MSFLFRTRGKAGQGEPLIHRYVRYLPEPDDLSIGLCAADLDRHLRCIADAQNTVCD